MGSSRGVPVLAERDETVARRRHQAEGCRQVSWQIGVKAELRSLHPRLLLAIIDSLSALHFELTASLPLRPLEKGRDILIFTSLPTSGLSHRDTYQSQPAQQEASQPESPVIVDMPPVPPPHDEVRHVDPEHRGLPWTSVLDEGPSTSPSNLPANDARLSTQAPPSAMPAPPDSRAESSASPYPLIPGSDQGMPRQRNVLVKKSLLRRRASVATNNSIRQSSDSIRSPSDSNQPADSIRHPSDPVRHPSDSIRYPSDPIRLPAAPHLHQAGDVNAIGDERVPRVDAVPQWNSSSYEGHHSADKSVDSAESRNSAYVDVDEDQPVGPLMLGVSMREAESTVPLRDVATRNRPTMVDVGGGIRIPSMHGSVGYLGRQSGMSGYTGSTPSGSELDRRPSGGDLGKRTSIGDAKGKAREVVWPEFEGNGGRGFGSARTRVSIGSR